MIRRVGKTKLLLLILLSPFFTYAQDATQDTIALNEVVVNAFYGRAKWQALPAAISIIREADLKKTPTLTFLPVMNSLAGVRMEERSPGSYRLSIRGSLLRSPFGVRNIKVYYEGLPLTDGGGNTYLNLIDLSQVTGAEVLKGPVAAVYGAGTGGAVLLRSPLKFYANPVNKINGGLAGGSYGLFRQLLNWEYATPKFSSSLSQVHAQSDGYREQSAMRRDGLKWQAAINGKQQNWRILSFYTDLYYQTPGGINETQYKQNPKQARQPAGALPGAVQQKTAIYNKTWFNGLHHELILNTNSSIQSFGMFSSTKFTNPFITNYEERKEHNTGFGTQWQYKQAKQDHRWQLNIGGEWQQQKASIDNFGNRSGVKDTVQYRDKVFATQWFLFSQFQYSFKERFTITVGVSTNQQLYRYKRLTDISSGYTKRKIENIFTPRLAMAYAIKPNLYVYGVIAKGFSAPSLAEFRPSDGNFYGDLNAESGWNLEAGIKGEILDNKLMFDIAFYRFKLNNAIVRRNSTSGTEYFVNAGSTLQRGIEAMVKPIIIQNGPGYIKELSVSFAYSFQPYRFINYQQGSVDYSNNKLTGVPSNTLSSAIDLRLKNGIYVSCFLNTVSAIPLNDINDAYAEHYELLQCRVGYKAKKWEIFMAIDNALNQTYSLGNDINALGRRYYNAAPGRNLLFGMNFELR